MPSSQLSSSTSSGRWDGASLEIAWERLVSIADEMGAALLHTAFSSVIREGNDFACALLTREGELLAEYSRSVPVFTGVLGGVAQSLIAHFADAVRPGDVLLTNDPWVGNTHLADFTAVTPIFAGDELLAFAGSICHVSDIGGASEAAFARDVFEEGFCVPPIKIREGGVVNEQVLYLLRRNVRVPQMVVGDLHALLAANDLGARRLLDAVGSGRATEFRDLTAAIASTTETAMRNAVRQLSDGQYKAAVQLDGYENEKTIAVTVRVHGDELTVDFTGTSPQSAFGINSAAPSRAYTLYSLKCVLCPELPNNAWTYRPITVEIPEGTLLNPRPPAPVSANFPAHFIQGALYLALHEAIPDAVMAPSGAPLWVVSFRGRAAERAFVTVLCFNGGQGALDRHDGHSCLSIPSNVANTPIEVVESEAPILFERKTIIRGSGGRGAWTGGHGQEVVLRSIHDEPIDVVFITERLNHAAPGLAGGGDGAVGALLVDRDTAPPPKGRHQLLPDSTITLRTPGGGGFGASRERGGHPSGTVQA